MGGIIGGSAPQVQQPDTSYLDEQRKRADEDRAKLDRENEAKRRNLRARRNGRQSLLFDTARGVQDDGLKATLGA